MQSETLINVLHEARRAIGDHFSPDDCYATGPLTGDSFRDLVQCPACSFIAQYDEAIAAWNARPDPKPSADSAGLREENARLRGALKDSAGSLSWAARQMKGNCRGSDIDAVNLAAGRAANSAALEGGRDETA